MFLILIIYILFLFYSNFFIKFKFKFVIMAIFKDEEHYIEEWLIHHINQGVQHFYLYCNDPFPLKYNNIFNKFSHKITLIPWVDKFNNGVKTIQKQAYTHCIQSFYEQFHFIMMLDIDEFIVNINKNDTVIDFLNTLDYNTEALKVQRFNFDSNGHVIKPHGNVMDNYTNSEKICSSYKTIANIHFVNKHLFFFGVHDFNLINKGKIYNKYLNYSYNGFPNKCSSISVNEIPLVINHYYSKSDQENNKRKLLWINGGVNPINYRL